jgi:chorismate synthase
MGGNSFGKAFRVTTFGESHGNSVGCVVDGCPPGVPISVQDIQKDLDKRKPGQSIIATQRKEEDKAVILSGILDGKTLGTPIAVAVENKDAKPEDYNTDVPRPGHADLTYFLKYGSLATGGGRSSGRETIGRVIAGAIAKKIIFPIEVAGHVIQVGDITAKPVSFERIKRDTDKTIVRCADLTNAKFMSQKIIAVQAKGDSIGGIVEVQAQNVPSRLGEPVFDKLSADIGKAMLSIPGIKGVEIGEGFRASKLKGSQNNDEPAFRNGKLTLSTNHSGGILGGISTGMPIVVRIAVKPTSSISLVQNSVSLSKKRNEKLKVEGRHDPCICPRIVPVAEAMLAIVLADHLLRSKAGKLI